jgi:hypothetical protein
MKLLKIFVLALFFGQSAIALGMTTDSEGNVTIDGTVISSDSPLIVTDVETDNLETFCDIGTLSTSGGVFQSSNGAQQFCSSFDRFCSFRQFGQNFYEGRFRQRQVFRGRGRDRFSARGNAWSLYLRFLNGNNGRNGRFQNRFNHQFVFSNNCG